MKRANVVTTVWANDSEANLFVTDAFFVRKLKWPESLLRIIEEGHLLDFVDGFTGQDTPQF